MVFNNDVVKEKLRSLGKTQEDLARDMGVGVGTVNRWLNKKHVPLKVYIRLLTEVLDEYETRKAHT